MRYARALFAASTALTAGGSLVALAGPASAATITPNVAGPSITTVAGNGTQGYSGDGGPAVKAALNIPTGVAEDIVGTLYFADTNNNRVRKVVQPTVINHDIISTIAGNGSAGFSGDNGQGTAAQLNGPSGVAVDTHGDVFVSDTGNNRVREILPSGIIKTYAGNGASCGRNPAGATVTNNIPATSASLCSPTGLALDHSGNLYISDSGHNRVREVTTAGIIKAFAGTGAYGSGGDGGQATSAQLSVPTGLAVDALGNVYIADSFNSKVREVSGGIITTFAGTGSFGYSGDGGKATKAKLSLPTGIGVDPSGDVFISDTGNSRIREVTPAGIISTYGGNGSYGFSGDGGPATAAKIAAPTGAVAADGSAVYFADTGNQRIRGIFNGPPPVLPQSDLVILLPVSGAVLATLGFVALRRRRRSSLAVS
jgi:sugar lactone lactonase YvrE